MPQFTRDPVVGPTDHCNGAANGGRFRCRHDADCLTGHGRALLEAFRNANPGVKFAADNKPCFGAIGTGSVRRRHRCEGYRFGIGSLIMNQPGLARIKNGATVYITQPYYTTAYDGFDGQAAALELARRISNADCVRKRLSGLTLEACYAGAGRSWYHPGSSALWVIGTPEALEAFDTDYPVPQPPEALRLGSRGNIQTTADNFDAPSPGPSWQVKLPDWKSRPLINRRNFRARSTAHDGDQYEHRMKAGRVR